MGHTAKIRARRRRRRTQFFRRLERSLLPLNVLHVRSGTNVLCAEVQRRMVQEIQAYEDQLILDIFNGL